MRKGCSYGTIVVDLDRHRVVDLLPDRTTATLAAWLERRPGIRVLARERSTEYARGASLGAPKALQMADRWHLLANMRQAVERWLHGAHVWLRHLPPAIGSTPPVPRRERAFPRSGSEREAGAESRARWKAVAKSAELNPTQLYRTLSEKGNPELRSLSAVLRTMGLRLAVQPLGEPVPHV